ncbi:MAG: hypothetical protein J6C23_03445 [Clostridia bacterium]|nr:hypothetical protein [Clostridia bacterium]
MSKKAFEIIAKILIILSGVLLIAGFVVMFQITEVRFHGFEFILLLLPSFVCVTAPFLLAKTVKETTTKDDWIDKSVIIKKYKCNQVESLSEIVPCFYENIIRSQIDVRHFLATKRKSSKEVLIFVHIVAGPTFTHEEYKAIIKDLRRYKAESSLLKSLVIVFSCDSNIEWVEKFIRCSLVNYRQIRVACVYDRKNGIIRVPYSKKRVKALYDSVMEELKSIFALSEEIQEN